MPGPAESRVDRAAACGSRALWQRITQAPHSGRSTGAVGEAFLQDWLKEIADTPAGKAIERRSAEQSLLRPLLAAIARGSPYLWDLLQASAARFVELLEQEPQRCFDAILSEAKSAVMQAHDDTQVMRLLRRMKADAALLVALADLGGVWPVTQLLEAQTKIADAAVDSAVRYLLMDPRVRGKLKEAQPPDPARCGYIVLAMGKMGANELNYSSDIDLIVFYDPAAIISGTEPAAVYLRLTRRLVKLLQERTADGYVFRVDLRLRPDPSSTQIAISIPAALDYYESRGQNWERAALIKARPCAGDLAAAERLLAELSPFIWRKYLDFASVADVHAMKRQIHVYRGHEEIAVEGHNLKLGRGGIREIEFFVQTQQLIAGGRHPELRTRPTLTTLGALRQGAWIDAQAHADLSSAYLCLRAIENRLQMVADEQTHTLPADRDQMERFALFAGFSGRDQFAETLLSHLRNVQRHYGSLFEHALPGNGAVAPQLSFPADADDRETIDRLAAMGFREPLQTSALVRRWNTSAYGSLRGSFAREQLSQIIPLLLHHFAGSAKPDEAVVVFDRFLAGLHGGGRLFSLLRQNPDLIALMGLVVSSAPRLADSLAQFPEVMDAVIDPSFFGPLPEESELATVLERSIRQAAAHEEHLDRIRIFAQEQMFLIGIRILSGTASPDQAGEAFARLCDVLIRSLHQATVASFVQQHGRMAEQEIAILALGKLGGREMTYTSDLDLIVVYDFDSRQPASAGPRPLYGSQYFTRLTQRLISALTAQTNYGVLYPVDMRLRPSGRSGPLATQIEGFAEYQEKEAWTWEHMALTRARVISSSTPQFGKRVADVIRTVLTRGCEPRGIAADVTEMRRAIATEKGETDPWDLKYAAGGLIDIEFIAQYLQLVHAAELPEILDPSTARVIEKAWRLGIIETQSAEVLRSAVRLYHALTQILRLCLPQRFDPAAASPALVTLLARAADVPDFKTLEAYLQEVQPKVRACFEHIVR